MGKSVKIPQEVYAGGAIRKYTQVDAEGFTEITEWDEQPFLDENKVIRDLNTRVDTSGMAWHLGARIPTPMIEKWYMEEKAKGGQQHAVRVTSDPNWLLQKCKEPDYKLLLVSDKV